MTEDNLVLFDEVQGTNIVQIQAKEFKISKKTLSLEKEETCKIDLNRIDRLELKEGDKVHTFIKANIGRIK